MTPKPHIYLVDDDPGALRSVTFLLERHDYKVTPFTEPQRLLDEANLQRFACLITDFRMPGMTGLELFQQLQARNVCLPTIIITGFGDIPTCSAAFRSGVCEFLEKPVHEQRLVESVEAATLQTPRAPQPMDKLRAMCETSELTTREAEVLSRVVQGQTLKQIAREFGTTIQTVSKQRIKLYEKLGVTSNIELLHRLLAPQG